MAAGWVSPSMHQGCQSRKEMQIFLWEASVCFWQALNAKCGCRWSHKHFSCCVLPQTGPHRQGIMLLSTSWYHHSSSSSALHVGLCGVWTWSWPGGANLWTFSSHVLSASPWLLWLRKDVSTALASSSPVWGGLEEPHGKLTKWCSASQALLEQ